ncbi:MAG: NlpC/P60 family protein [Pontibacterium sp.]
MQSDNSDVKRALMMQYSDWKGTQYRYGGMSKQGVDCSAFVLLTYQSRLGQRLPRTTLLQSRIGSPVSRRELRAGDLVFFKTSYKVRHVGIFIGDAQFLHASTSKGVTISSLDNNYWSARYWMAKRPNF